MHRLFSISCSVTSCNVTYVIKNHYVPRIVFTDQQCDLREYIWYFRIFCICYRKYVPTVRVCIPQPVAGGGGDYSEYHWPLRILSEIEIVCLLLQAIHLFMGRLPSLNDCEHNNEDGGNDNGTAF